MALHRVSRLCRAILGIAILSFAFMAVTLEAQSTCGPTPLPTLVSGTTLTAACSPYLCAANTSFAGVTIQAGVVIQAAPGVTISLLTAVSAVGTAAQPVLFTSQGAGLTWDGLSSVAAPPSIVLDNCIVERAANSGYRIIASSPAISNCIFRLNATPTNGGALDINNPTQNVAISNTVFDMNSAAVHGGGVNALMGTGSLSLTGCTFTANAANPAFATVNSVGGGLRLSGGGQIDACTFENNVVRAASAFQVNTGIARGGGLWVEASPQSPTATVQLRWTAILANSALASNATFVAGHARGGGVHVQSGVVDFQNCLIGCNTAALAVNVPGAGIYCDSGTSTLTNCTVTKNNSTGLHAQAAATLTVGSSIVYFNNGGFTNPTAAQFAGTVAFTYSDIQGAGVGTGNFDFNPVFVNQLGCTVADLTILPFSPCVNAGDPTRSNACIPPGIGTIIEDCGAHGGPTNCGWAITPPVVAAAYPGSSGDLVLASSVSPALSSGVVSYVLPSTTPDVKPFGGTAGVLTFQLTSPALSLAGVAPLLAAQMFVTGSTPPSAALVGFPQIWLSPIGTPPPVVIYDGLLNPFGVGALAPPGLFLSYYISSALPPGTSVMVQGFAPSPTGTATPFVATDAHEIQF